MATVRSEWNQKLRRTRLFAVTSGKGGVGKTTIAVNVAIAFAQQGLRTLLFDADLGMANVHIYAGVNPTATLVDVVDRRANLSDVIVPGPCGIQVVCGGSGVGRLTDLSAPVLEALGRELLRVAADFDALVIDTGAGISASVMQFLGIVQEVIVVATPNLAAILDAYGVIKCMSENRIGARIHLLINQAATTNEAVRVQERIAGCASRFLQTSLNDLGFLLRDPIVERANQSRRPLLISEPDHLNASRLTHIAASLANMPVEPLVAQALADSDTAAA
ncbi:MAG: P-loop NTPase [Verrucomicrobiota bacterium]|nr:P-loop NTPase [Verrucomicrobiota bacterium]